MSFLVAFLTAFTLTALLVPLTARLSRAVRVVAHPARERWRDRTVPKLGGLAMFAGIVAVAWIEQILPALWPVIVTMGLMFLVGFIDDLYPISAPAKFALQAIVAIGMLTLLPITRIVGVPWVDAVIGFFWLVGLTNAFNLLDNMDGLAAGVAAIAGLGLVIVLRLDGGSTLIPYVLAVAALAGAAAGFLLHNMHPASIFMGDCGSHLLGAFLASVTWFGLPHETSGASDVYIPAVLLLLPICDTGFVVITRMVAGRSPFTGGRDHVSHRLVQLGLTARQAVMVLWGVGAIAACTAIGLRGLPPGLGIGFAALNAAALVLLLMYLAAVGADRSGKSRLVLPLDFIARHPLFAIALDAVLLTAAYHVSFVIRFQQPQFNRFLPYFVQSLPVVVALQSLGVWVAGQNRRGAVTARPNYLWNLAKGALVGVAASVIALLSWRRFQGYSRGVFALDAVLAPAFVIGARLLLARIDDLLRPHTQPRRPALVYGAGNAGALALRELWQNRDLSLAPVGILDDDAAKCGREIDGVPVIGGVDYLERLLLERERAIAVVVIAIRDLPADRLEHVRAVCDAADIELRRMRFALEPLERRDRSTTIVKFPGA